MRPLLRILTLTACVLALALPALAQDALSKRVSLDLKGMAPSDAFTVLADAISLRVVVDPEVTAPIDILVRNVTARTALTTMCESIGCRWSLAAGTIAVKPGSEVKLSLVVGKDTSETKISEARKVALKASAERIRRAVKQTLPAGMKFENAPLEEVSARLSEALGISLRLLSGDPAIRTLTADFSNRTLVETLQALPMSGNKISWRLAFAETDAAGKEVAGATFMIGVGPKRK